MLHDIFAVPCDEIAVARVDLHRGPLSVLQRFEHHERGDADSRVQQVNDPGIGEGGEQAAERMRRLLALTGGLADG